MTNPNDRETREDLLLREAFTALRSLSVPESDRQLQIMDGLASIPAPRRRPKIQPYQAAASVMMALLLLPAIVRTFPGSREGLLTLVYAAGTFLQNLGTLTWFGFRTLLSVVSAFSGAVEPLTRNETLRTLVQVSAWTLLGAGFAIMSVSIGITLLRDLRATSPTLTIRDLS
jgi:hypothetical protein